jgi:hypothetical protein
VTTSKHGNFECDTSAAIDQAARRSTSAKTLRGAAVSRPLPDFFPA